MNPHLIVLLCLIACGCHRNEATGAWNIVKQKGMENYGYVTEMGTGFVIAGYTNKAMAIAAMEERRDYIRRPPKPIKPKVKETIIWEFVP